MVAKALLFIQVLVLLVFPDFMRLKYVDASPAGIALSLTRVSLGLGSFRFLLSVRVRIARLPRKRLSRYLTDNLIVPTLIFIGIATFFALDPIRCWLESRDDFEVCDRTSIGQSGLLKVTEN